jgi:hypothetical protein
MYKENKSNAFALIMGHCNKIMQNCIEEIADYETRIYNDPEELMDEIKKKMYNPARAKYEYITLMEAIKIILDTKQEDTEG